MKLSNLLPWRKKPVRQKSWVDTDQGMMNTSWDAGWWQQNLKGPTHSGNEVVEACVSALSQTVAMCPVYLLSDQDDGEAKRMKGANPERVLRNPNPYTTRSLFFNDLIRSVYYHGNGYAVATRDGNRAIKDLYNVNPKNCNGVIDPETGDVYYWISPNFGKMYNPDTDQIHPARDVLNVRINQDPNHPLKGLTPITVAANSIGANSAIIGQQSQFFSNMNRSSGVLSTDTILNKEQMTQLREAFDAQSKGNNAGKTPILGGGLKYQQMSLTSQDAQMVEALQMTVETISRVFRVPPPVINSMTGMTFNNSEALMSWFLASGLGFILEHIELELDKLFGLSFDQHLNFNTKALLRSDWKTQIEALGEGTLKGIYSPNEARAMVGLGAVADGDEPRVQQQVVPLSAWDKEPEPEPEPDVDVMAAFTKGYQSAR